VLHACVSKAVTALLGVGRRSWSSFFARAADAQSTEREFAAGIRGQDESPAPQLEAVGRQGSVRRLVLP
jgi:hypothetical protein